MRRILILNYEFPPLGGGAANATYYLLKEFAKDETLQIDLVTSSVDKYRTEQFAPNITIHYLDIGKKGNLHYQSNKDLLKYSYQAYKYSKKLVKNNEYDLVHAFFGIPCGFIAMRLGLPYIVSLRGSDVPFYNARFYWLDTLLFKRLSQRIWRHARAVVANSQELKNLAHRSVPEQEIGIIYNGVDIAEFTPKDKEDQHQTKLTLISTGRLIERKGYRYLIEALAGLEDVSLTLIGDGNQRTELEALAATHGVSVTFLGPQPHEDIPALLTRADVFVLPSLNEGMSNSILEAMAAGLPIIATDTGGSAELIDGNGIIVSKADVAALRAATLTLKADPTLRATMRARSRERALKMSWQAVAGEYRKLYELA